MEDLGCRDGWFDAEHAAWVRFLSSIDLPDVSLVSLYRRSLDAERRAAALLKAGLLLR
jgi:hypothetical protein